MTSQGFAWIDRLPRGVGHTRAAHSCKDALVVHPTYRQARHAKEQFGGKAVTLETLKNTQPAGTAVVFDTETVKVIVDHYETLLAKARRKLEKIEGLL